MMHDRRVVWAIVGTTALILGVIFLSEPVKKSFRPTPESAWIAIEVGDEGVARPGRAEVTAGQAFRLHAVLEARDRGGRQLYFTEAPGLEIDGRRVPAEDLRRWEGPEELKILWFSIEGPRPYVELPGDRPLEELAFQALFRADWPRAWSIPGSIRPAREAELADEGAALRLVPFGTMRYQVRLELFGVSSALVPVATFESAPPQAAVDEAPSVATVVVVEPGALEIPSRVFGLTEIAFQGLPAAADTARLAAWFERDLAFSRILLLRAMLSRAGITWEELQWSQADLADGPEWGGGGAVGEGDLLRAGERVVVLYADLGDNGRLGYEDLCMDFLEGPQIRRLGDVFTGEGLVEVAALGTGDSGRDGA
jgi:hypothetical protein